MAQLWNLGQPCCCTGQKYCKIVRNIYILYNSVCCIHFKPLQIQLNYWNCPPFNFNVHRPPSALKPQELSLQQPIRRTSSWQRVGLLTRSYNQIWWFLCIVISVFIFLGAYVGSKKMNPQYNIPLQPIWLKLSIPIYSAD